MIKIQNWQEYVLEEIDINKLKEDLIKHNCLDSQGTLILNNEHDKYFALAFWEYYKNIFNYSILEDLKLHELDNQFDRLFK